MNALITGAGGFIGSRLAARLLERGDAVRGLFMHGEDTRGLEEKGLEMVRGDVTEPSTLEGIERGIDTVFHLAARVADWGPVEAYRDVSVCGTANLLERSAGKVERFVYMSSIAYFGTTRHCAGFTEDTAPVLTGLPYNDAKIEAEALVRGYTFGTDTSYTIIRPTNVFGPGSIWVRDIIEAFGRGPLPLCDGGRHSASLVYVENLVDGILLAADSPRARDRVYILRDDYRVTWREYLSALGAMVGKKPGPSMPTWLLFYLGWLVEAIYAPFYPARPPLTRHAVSIMGHDFDADTTRAREELGWSTRIPYDEAMESVARYVRETFGDI
ncbi:MAG: NAD-dependent epimerase/dehydratase family protein [Actinobacteria bacterium]|nr:NAD-dependent epimerase/dehydratase family protein [Actinomycetota bacterium]MBU1942354.1 NAD-dependent epimerase/dehydratase family protein [Actinomycetota bacterium]MBU2686348.1 NAD-dependent epimerase/dehydratase family protein [Actinomycetota bacterium]